MDQPVMDTLRVESQMTEQSVRYPSLDGLRVFVTGGASGIGAAITKGFADQGARVRFVDLNDSAGRGLVSQLPAAQQPRVDYDVVDASDGAALQAAVSAFADTAGGVDVLVNNVANDTRQSLEDISPTNWRASLAVNLDSAFFATQQAVQAMGENGGSIINMSSINPLFGPPDQSGYIASKGAILGLTKGLARELGPKGIRVNAVLPGWVATERQLELWLTPEKEAEWAKLTALPGRIQPEDIANMVLFLASDQARMITGQQFIVDAGRL